MCVGGGGGDDDDGLGRQRLALSWHAYAVHVVPWAFAANGCVWLACLHAWGWMPTQAFTAVAEDVVRRSADDDKPRRTGGTLDVAGGAKGDKKGCGCVIS